MGRTVERVVGAGRRVNMLDSVLPTEIGPECNNHGMTLIPWFESPRPIHSLGMKTVVTTKAHLTLT